jgi:hypothetical protein
MNPRTSRTPDWNKKVLPRFLISYNRIIGIERGEKRRLLIMQDTI